MYTVSFMWWRWLKMKVTQLKPFENILISWIEYMNIYILNMKPIHNETLPNVLSLSSVWNLLK